jgi:hypothetical protein
MFYLYDLAIRACLVGVHIAPQFWHVFGSRPHLWRAAARPQLRSSFLRHNLPKVWRTNLAPHFWHRLCCGAARCGAVRTPAKPALNVRYTRCVLGKKKVGMCMSSQISQWWSGLIDSLWYCKCLLIWLLS